MNPEKNRLVYCLARSGVTKIYLLAFLIFGITALPVRSEEDLYDIWSGEYSYELDGGSTVGGTSIGISYLLTINKSSKNKCVLSIEGYQTDRQIICTIKGTKNAIDIDFKTFGDGRVLNEFDVTEFQPGEILLRLDNSAQRLSTYWVGLYIDEFVARKNPGAYFVKKSYKLEKKK